MNDLLAPVAPATAPAISPAALGLATEEPVATAPSPVAAPAAEAPNHDDDAASSTVRKTPDEVFAELDQKYLRAHKGLASAGERRRIALDWLDEQRDKLRLSIRNVRMTDAECDALLTDFVTAALAASKGA